MSERKATTLFEHLSEIKDPRIERTKWHKLIDILVIAICATICGAESYPDMEEFGRDKEEWLRTFLELENGIPSHDTFRRVFMLIKPVEFQRSFLNWVEGVRELTDKEVIGIDGKQSRGSKKKNKKSKIQNEGLRMVSAWAVKNRLVLGQQKTQEKSNEITAIPELLRLLSLKGCIVTIDAMGCQREIVKQIVEQEADYVISLKGNQGNLHKDVKDYFTWAEKINYRDIEYDYCETVEKGHGRIETRRCWVTEDIDWLEEKDVWAGLKSIVMVEAEREVIGKAISVERRYFISSLSANAKESLNAVRSHWQIENSLHWVLDVGFREDDCQIKDENAAANMATLRHITLNLLNQEKSCKRGVKGKRLKAAWNQDYLLKVLQLKMR
jgi:predicted transposase YbfD/YdcC